MGCGDSKSSPVPANSTNSSLNTLTEAEKHAVQSSWKQFSSEDKVDNGFEILFYIFRKHPETKKLFYFIDDGASSESLKSNYRFRSHVGLFCETIRIAVEEMRDLDDILLFMKDLGRRHRSVGASVRYIRTAGDAIIYSLQKTLGKQFTPYKKKAWTKFYKILSDEMVKGLLYDD